MEKGLKMKGCKKLEVALEILKADYDKLWLSLIAVGGGTGTILFKSPEKIGLLALTFLVGFGLVIALLFVRLKISKIAELLEKCEEDNR